MLVLPLGQAWGHRRSGIPRSVVGPPRLRLGHRLHVELAVTQVDPHALAGLDLASEQPFRELVLQQPLDGSSQRARPVLWVEAGVRPQPASASSSSSARRSEPGIGAAGSPAQDWW